MFLKRYTVAAFLLIGLVGAYIYAYITQDSYSLDLFGVILPPISIAVLVMVPLVALYIASVLHISFYSLLSNLKLRKYNNDYDKFVLAIIDALFAKKERKNSFKTSRYKLLGSILDNMIIAPISEMKSNSENEKLNQAFTIINDIKSGKVVDLKAFGLRKDNEYMIHNNKNAYINGDITAEDVLSHAQNYADLFCKEVYVDLVKKAPLHAIEKYKEYLTQEAFFEILKRINAQENTLEVSNTTIIFFMENLRLDAKDYIEMSKITSTEMIPDQRLKLFESISEKNEKGMNAYIYTLLDLEMISVAATILDNSQENEFINFKAYMALRECNKNFNIELFI